MQRLVLIMIVVATTFDFLSKGDSWGRFAYLPRPATYLGELLGGFVLLYVVVAGTRNRFQYVRPAYWFAFGTLLFTMVAGILLNQVEPGPIFAGLRITCVRSPGSSWVRLSHSPNGTSGSSCSSFS